MGYTLLTEENRSALLPMVRILRYSVSGEPVNEIPEDPDWENGTVYEIESVDSEREVVHLKSQPIPVNVASVIISGGTTHREINRMIESKEWWLENTQSLAQPE